MGAVGSVRAAGSCHGIAHEAPDRLGAGTRHGDPGEQRGDGHPEREPQARAPAARRHGLASLERVQHDGAGARPVARHLDAFERTGERIAAFAHGRSPSSSESRSSARRRRELTVPRGSSSSFATCPGV